MVVLVEVEHAHHIFRVGGVSALPYKHSNRQVDTMGCVRGQRSKSIRVHFTSYMLSMYILIIIQLIRVHFAIHMHMYTVLMAHTVLSIHVVTHSLLVAMVTHCSRHVTHRSPAQPGSAARCGRGPGWKCESDSGWDEWEWELEHIQSRDRSSGSSVRTKKRKNNSLETWWLWV